MKNTAHILDLAKILQVDKNQVIQHLKVPLGSEVQAGDILAERKTALKKIQVKAPARSIVVALSDDGGLELLSSDDESAVKALKNDRSADSPAADREHNDLAGTAFFLDPAVKIYDIDDDVADKIVIFPEKPSSALVYKLSAMGAKAIVFLSSVKDELKLNEELCLPILVFDNKEHTVNQTKKWHNQKITVKKNRIEKSD